MTLNKRLWKSPNEKVTIKLLATSEPSATVWHINNYFGQFPDSDWSKPDHVGILLRGDRPRGPALETSINGP